MRSETKYKNGDFYFSKMRNPYTFIKIKKEYFDQTQKKRTYSISHLQKKYNFVQEDCLSDIFKTARGGTGGVRGGVDIGGAGGGGELKGGGGGGKSLGGGNKLGKGVEIKKNTYS